MERKYRVINLVIITQLQNCFVKTAFLKKRGILHSNRHHMELTPTWWLTSILTCYQLQHISLISAEQLSNTQGQLLPPLGTENTKEK